MSQIKIDEYKGKYLINDKVEWLIEHGKIHQVVYFKGAIGDRYTIYVATKRNKNTVDFCCIYNGYDYGTCKGTHIATIKDYTLTITIDNNNKSSFWYGCGYTVKQLMRQGIVSKKFPWTLRYCRSAYFMKLSANPKIDGITHFTPWPGMKVNLKTGLLINKPNRWSTKEYKTAKKTDSDQRKANYLANKNNREALQRYRDAGGDTTQARRTWDTTTLQNVENINWDLIPMDDVFKHRNATLRSNILEHYGMNAILKTLKYKVVDEDTIDGRLYKLLDVELPDLSNNRRFSGLDDKGLYLEMINPSTGESHFEGVANVGNWNAPKEATVKAALCWRDGDTILQSGSQNGSTGELYIKPVTLT